MTFLCMQQDGGSVGYMLCLLSVVLASSQNLGPLSTEVMEGQTGGVRSRSPLSLFHELRLFNGFRSHLTRAPKKDDMKNKTKQKSPFKAMLPVERSNKINFLS